MRTVVYSKELEAVVNTLRHMPEDESLDAQLAQFAALVGKAEYEGRSRVLVGRLPTTSRMTGREDELLGSVAKLLAPYGIRLCARSRDLFAELRPVEVKA